MIISRHHSGGKYAVYCSLPKIFPQREGGGGGGGGGVYFQDSLHSKIDPPSACAQAHRLSLGLANGTLAIAFIS